MNHTGKSRRINGSALEMIMQDVLSGMQSFTRETCAGSARGTIEVLAVERPDNQTTAGADIIPFRKPGTRR